MPKQITLTYNLHQWVQKNGSPIPNEQFDQIFVPILDNVTVQDQASVTVYLHRFGGHGVWRETSTGGYLKNLGKWAFVVLTLLVTGFGSRTHIYLPAFDSLLHLRRAFRICV